MKHESITIHLSPRQSVGTRQKPTKLTKVQWSAAKVLGSILQDLCDILFIYYFEQGKTATREYYAVLLDRSNKEIKKETPHMAKKNVLFHQDNVLVPHIHENDGKIEWTELWILQPLLHILQICPPGTIIYSPTWRGGSRGRYLHQMRMLNVKLVHIVEPLQVVLYQVYKLSYIKCTQILQWHWVSISLLKKTMLINKIHFRQKKFVSLLVSELFIPCSTPE